MDSKAGAKHQAHGWGTREGLHSIDCFSPSLRTQSHGWSGQGGTAEGDREPCIHRREAERDEGHSSVCFLLSIQFRGPVCRVMSLTVRVNFLSRLNISKPTLTDIPRVVSLNGGSTSHKLIRPDITSAKGKILTPSPSFLGTFNIFSWYLQVIARPGGKYSRSQAKRELWPH